MFLAGSSLFGPRLAVAAPKCDSLFSSEYALHGRLEIESAVRGVLPAQSYVQRLSEIHALLGNLEPATDSRITIGRVFEFSAFNGETKSVYVGIRPDSMGKRNPEINLNILAHEYGHAIFEKNLSKDLESYRALKKDLLEAEKTETEIKALAEQALTLIRKSDVTFDKAAKAQLLARAQDLVAQGKFQKVKLGHLNRQADIRSALHEVFADAVTLAVTKDPHSIEKVLRDSETTYKSYSNTEIMLRDMSAGKHRRTQEAWSKEIKGQKKLFGEFLDNAYYALMPARWELWRISKSRLDGDLYRKEFLTKVFTILERNFSEVLAQPPEKLGVFKGFKDIERLNQQIIEDFRREL